MALKLQGVQGQPEGVLKEIAVGLGGEAQELTFLASSRVTVMLPVLGPRSESHRFRGRVNGVRQRVDVEKGERGVGVTSTLWGPSSSSAMVRSAPGGGAGVRERWPRGFFLGKVQLRTG